MSRGTVSDTILIDATALQSEHRLRGVGVYLANLIAGLEAETTLGATYLTSRIGGELVTGVLPRARTTEFVRPHRPAQVYWLYNELVFRRALNRIRPRVFFCPDFNGVVANPFGRTVAVLYDLTAMKLPPGALGPSQALSDWRWRAYARKLKAADHVIAVSTSAKKDAVALLSIPPEKITVIHLGLDHDRFNPGCAGEQAEINPPYFLHVGGFNDNKNQARVLRAFAAVATAHRDVELHFSGTWHESDIAWLQKSAESLGVGDRVKHLGYVAAERLPMLYANAAAFVFPSLEEGFGMPVLEAMACGTPVITSDCSSLPEVAGDAALLVDPYSIEALGAAMSRLLDDPDERSRLRTAGLLRAASFNWRITAQRTAAVLLGSD